jgi:hypothetical protein
VTERLPQGYRVSGAKRTPTFHLVNKSPIALEYRTVMYGRPVNAGRRTRPGVKGTRPAGHVGTWPGRRSHVVLSCAHVNRFGERER